MLVIITCGLAYCLIVCLSEEVTISLNDSVSVLTLFVGPHKTGSSTTESLLVKLRGALAQDDIFLCDGFDGKFNRLSAKNGANLAEDIVTNSVSTNNINILHKCLSHPKYKQVIVAAERFDDFTDGSGIRLLQSALPRIRAIVTMRDLPDWIRSVYHQDCVEGQSFKSFVHMILETRESDDAQMRVKMRQNSYHVSRRYQHYGIHVIHVPFVDMTFLFCTAIGSPTSCSKLKNSEVEVSHLNDKKALHKDEQCFFAKKHECAPRADIMKLESVLVEKYSVPPGLDWSLLICPE